MAPWLNWIEQPPPKGQVTGSSPVGVTKSLIFKTTYAIQKFTVLVVLAFLLRR